MSSRSLVAVALVVVLGVLILSGGGTVVVGGPAKVISPLEDTAPVVAEIAQAPVPMATLVPAVVAAARPADDPTCIQRLADVGEWLAPVVDKDGRQVFRNGRGCWKRVDPLPFPTPKPPTMAEKPGVKAGYVMTCYADGSCARPNSSLKEFSLWDQGGAWFIIDPTGYALRLDGCKSQPYGNYTLVTCSPTQSFSLGLLR